MVDKRVALRKTDILEKLSAARAARLNEVQQHAYRIDPGMALAQEVWLRETFPTIGRVTSIVQDDQGISVSIEIDRTMPETNLIFGPPTTKMALDEFDAWAAMR